MNLYVVLMVEDASNVQGLSLCCGFSCNLTGGSCCMSLPPFSPKTDKDKVLSVLN